MAKVLISDKISPLAEGSFRERGIDVDVRTDLSDEELKATIAAYDGLAVRSTTRVTAAVIAAGTNLKVIGRAGIGVDNIDVEAATARGIAVMNTPYGNAITTAEHAITLLLAMARQIPQANASTHAGKWEKAHFMGVEITGKTLGIIGCGHVGEVVADRAKGIKMKVITYDPYLSEERSRELAVEKVSFDELLARSHFITVHTPLTDATRGLIDADAIARMRPDVRIINCARGGIVVEEDLKAALESGHVAGAALDVFTAEPATECVLFGMEQVIATPHLGAATAEAQEKVAHQVAEEMADYLSTGAVANAVNMPSLSAEDAHHLMPYMALAEQLGSFAGQVTETAIKAVTIEYEGRVTEFNTKPLTAKVLLGLLRPLLDDVNMVNAPLVARKRHIDVSEVRNERSRGYETLIRLSVTTETQVRGIAGTLFDGRAPRIVEIKGIPMDARLGAHMLYVTNADRPGIIGNLGRVLGEAEINIASFNLGRNLPGGDSIALIEVDSLPANTVLDRLRALPHVTQAKALQF